MAAGPTPGGLWGLRIGEIDQETYQLNVDGSQKLGRTEIMTIANRRAI
jgi:hypothetical protein